MSRFVESLEGRSHMSVANDTGATAILDSVAAQSYNLRVATTATTVTRVQAPTYLQRTIVSRNLTTGAANVQFNWTISTVGPRATHTRLVIRQQQSTGGMVWKANMTFSIPSTGTNFTATIGNFQKGGVYSVTAVGMRKTVSSTGTVSITLSGESYAVWVKP